MHAAEQNLAHQAQQLAVFGASVEQCYQRTAAALYETRAATQEELSKCITIARESNRSGIPADILEILARLKGIDEEHLSPVIAGYSDLVAAFSTPHAPLLPFAGKLITPSTFYDAFPTLKAAGRSFLSPIIFAEDTDAIGIASINAIACQMMGELVVQTAFEKTGIRPFITIARLDYTTWSFLTRKHFGI